MNYLSVCSGIEAATVAWHGLGWTPIAFSEIEPFPSAVLAHHWPDIPNLGDMKKHHEWPNTFRPDLIVGGTPCQAFSVAGLRKGLEDPRGNLTLVFLGVLARFRPRWVVWENVPGVLSDKTGALANFLDGLIQLAYIPDIDILDAQWFGVPQRRRRVFVVAQSREDFLSKKTLSSAATIAQCLIEILHGICLAGSSKFESVRQSLDSANLSRDGVQKRMKLFGICEDECLWPKLLEHLEEAALNCPQDAKNLDLENGESVVADMLEDWSRDFQQANPFTNTGQSWKDTLADAYEVMKSFITSTTTKTITESGIFICSKAVASIGSLILRLKRSSPSSWQAGQSFLTALLDFTNYARLPNVDLFERMERIHPWGDFLKQTANFDIVVGYLGDWRRAAAVLFEREGVRRDSPPAPLPYPTLDCSTIGNKWQSNQWVKGGFAIADYRGVRKATVTECERLQGFPDNHTRIPWRGRHADECPDGPRYKALGNSMAVPVMRWIGERIQSIEALIQKQNSRPNERGSD